MQAAIVELMPDSGDAAKDSNSPEGLWQVVIVEKDETGDVIQNSPNNAVYRTGLSHDEALSVAAQFVQELRKAREENQNE